MDVAKGILSKKTFGAPDPFGVTSHIPNAASCAVLIPVFSSYILQHL